MRKGAIKSKKYPEYYKSFIDGISDAAVELFNISSQLNNMFTGAGFQFVAGPDVQNVSTLGAKSYFSVPPGGMIPSWVAPAADLFRVYFEREDMLITRIYQQAGIKDRTADSSAAAKSAAQVIVEDRRSEDRVKMIADTVRDFELDMWRLMCYRAGDHRAAEQIDIQYPHEYDTKTIQDELEHLEAIGKTRNREWRLYEINKMLLRKIPNEIDRKRIYRAFENGINLRLEDVANTKELNTFLEIGAISATDVARDVNPQFDDQKQDVEVLKKMTENAAQYSELKNDLGIGNIEFGEAEDDDTDGI